MAEPTPKLCPLLMIATNQGRSSTKEFMAYCLESKCTMWIELYTTEGIKAKGCSIALNPIIVDGELKV